MKIPFPLSLKVSCWLLLNLVLLAGAGGIFLVTQAGFGWDALVVGAAGSRLQATADLIGAELRAEPRSGWDAVLKHYSTEYGVEFALFQSNGRQLQLAGPAMPLPDPVRARVGELRGPRPGPGPGQGQRNGGRPPPEGAVPAAVVPGAPLPGGGPAPGGPAFGPGGPPPGGGQRGAAEDFRSQRGRFFMRTTYPTAYWIGVGLPPLPNEGGAGGGPSTLVLQAGSLLATAPLLDLTPWLVVATAAIGLSVIFWLPLVRSITHALGQLTRATEQIAEGRFDTRVGAGRRDEIGRLGGAVNRMAGQLDQLVTGQKRFLGDIAHELGSPVGRMQVAVGILEERVPAELQPAVADVREEVQQMSALVVELLAFTKAGLKLRDAELVRVELAPLVAQALAREAAELRVMVSIAPGLAVAADAALLARALGNLVRNALRYAGDAGPITLTAAAEGGEAVIAVEDQGPGVPEETLARLGEPFYRPELARTRETGGAGLGLAIVRGGVEACRGTVRFSNRVPRGFRAEVRLAVADVAAPDSE